MDKKSPRKEPSSDLKRKLQQEAQSLCPFCGNADTATWQYHHIDEDRSNTVYENMILTCANCHSKIRLGDISPTDVFIKKRQIRWEFEQGVLRTRNTEDSSVNSIGDNNRIIGSFNNIKITAPAKTIKIQHPDGSIGADVACRGYVDYLIDKLIIAQDKSGLVASHQKVHTTIQRCFGGKVFFLPTSKMDDLVNFLQDKIDKTKFCRGLAKSGKRFYHSRQEHIEKMNL